MSERDRRIGSRNRNKSLKSRELTGKVTLSAKAAWKIDEKRARFIKISHEGFEEAGANRHRSRRQTVLDNVGNVPLSLELR
jgi:hypothetical protein